MTASTTAPHGLNRHSYTLARTETWERFSLHGVKALLALDVIDDVLIGDTGAILGLAALRSLTGSLSGP